MFIIIVVMFMNSILDLDLGMSQSRLPANL
jgi:hypothetical protein